jgi:hypothetical protein
MLPYVWQLLCFLQGGSVPHLTYEVLQMVSKEQHLLHIPISTVAQCYEAVSAFKKGIADFIGLKVVTLQLFIFICVHFKAVINLWIICIPQKRYIRLHGMGLP